MDGEQLMELLRSPHVTISVDGTKAGNLVATRLRLAMVPVSRRPSPPKEYMYRRPDGVVEMRSCDGTRLPRIIPRKPRPDRRRG